MKAEEDFMNSLSADVAIKITNAGIKRFNKTKETSVKPIKYANYSVAAATPTVSISSLACQCILCKTSVPGDMFPTTTPEAPPQMGQRNDTMSDLDTARRHMDNRLYRVKSDKRDALKTQFGLTYDYPKTYADMKARLLAGKFTLPSDEENEYASLDDLEWRDPAVKKDRPGFEAAEKLLDAAATKVKDAIWVKTNPEDALAALEAFESSTVN